MPDRSDMIFRNIYAGNYKTLKGLALDQEQYSELKDDFLTVKPAITSQTALYRAKKEMLKNLLDDVVEINIKETEVQASVEETIQNEINPKFDFNAIGRVEQSMAEIKELRKMYREQYGLKSKKDTVVEREKLNEEINKIKASVSESDMNVYKE